MSRDREAHPLDQPVPPGPSVRAASQSPTGQLTPLGIAATDHPRSWSVGENDYGGLVIFHIHEAGEAPAYVIDRSSSGVLAQCSECVEYLEMRGMADAPNAAEAPERAG